MKTIRSCLSRRGQLLCLLTLLGVALAGCGQPQSSAAADSQASAATTQAEQPTTMPTAMPTEQPTTMPTAMPTEQPAAPPTASPTAMPAGHDHMASSAPAMAGSGGPEVEAAIKLFSFSPEPLQIKAGTTVVWTNGDDIEHSVTSGTPPTPDGTFDSDFFTKGQTYAFTFDTPGQYAYFCKRHNSMIGMVEVTP